MAREEDRECADAVKSRVDQLIEAGCVQISRKHRLVGFVPAGMTGLDALTLRDPVAASLLVAKFAVMLEKEACVQYGREFPTQLTVNEFNEYLGKTGRQPIVVEGCKYCSSYTKNHDRGCPNA